MGIHQETHITLLQNQTIVQFLTSIDNKTDLLTRIAFCQAIKTLNMEQDFHNEILDVLINIDIHSIRNVTCKSCIKAYHIIKGLDSVNDDLLLGWTQMIKKKFPFIQ